MQWKNKNIEPAEIKIPQTPKEESKHVEEKQMELPKPIKEVETHVKKEEVKEGGSRWY